MSDEGSGDWTMSDRRSLAIFPSHVAFKLMSLASRSCAASCSIRRFGAGDAAVLSSIVEWSELISWRGDSCCFSCPSFSLLIFRLVLRSCRLMFEQTRRTTVESVVSSSFSFRPPSRYGSLCSYFRPSCMMKSCSFALASLMPAFRYHSLVSSLTGFQSASVVAVLLYTSVQFE